MSTIRQLQANRLNAQLSTGPRSVEGKAVVSMNALKSGIDSGSLAIPGECYGTLCGLMAEYTDHHQPATPAERTLVDSLIRAEWRLRRLDKIERQLWFDRFEKIAESHGGHQVYARDLEERHAFGTVYAELDKTFARLQSRINSCERSYRTALRDLQRLQDQRLAADAGDQTPAKPTPIDTASPQPIDPESTSARIGFVPQIPPAASPAPVEPEPTPIAAPSPQPTHPEPTSVPIGFVPQKSRERSEPPSPDPGPLSPAPSGFRVHHRDLRSRMGPGGAKNRRLSSPAPPDVQ